METHSNNTKANPLHKILIIALLVLSMLASATATAMADPGSDEDGTIILDGQLEQDEEGDPEPQIGADTPSELRRYVITYTSFYAVDETGPDWSGSDEMSFLLSSTFGEEADHDWAVNPGMESLVRETAEYGDVDTGDLVYFRGLDICRTPAGCSSDSPGVAGPIILTATAIENDDGSAAFDDYFIQGLVDLLEGLGVDGSEVDDETVTGFILHALGDYYNSVMDNDQFGFDVERLSTAELEQAMPYVGRGTVIPMTVAGWGGDWIISGDGEYRVSAHIRRVADAQPESSEWDDAPVLVDTTPIAETSVDETPTMTTGNGPIEAQEWSENTTLFPGSSSTPDQPTRGSGSAVGGRSLFGR